MLAELSPLLLSLLVGLAATALAFVPALLLARWLARSRSRLRPLVESLVVLPMVLPPVVVGYFLLLLFGRQGPLGFLGLAFSFWAAALAAVVMGFPLMLRSMRQAFEEVDPGLEEVAATLGAGPLRRFWTITVPLAWRGVVAGTALCFARSLGEFGATITFAGNIQGQTQTLPLAIWTALQRADGEAEAWRLTWLCVALSVLATLSCELLLRRRRAA